MKSKLIALSAILILVVLVSGTSMAWFLSNDAETNNFKLGTVKVKVVEPGFENLENVEATSYDKNVQVQSLGSKRTYVRVRLVAEWSDPSLAVSNVKLNLASNGDWTEQQADGYYYFKYYLEEGQTTSLLLDSVTFTELGQEYEGAVFSLHVVAEGVQITHEGWKDVWGLDTLPFTPEVAWTAGP